MKRRIYVLYCFLGIACCLIWQSPALATGVVTAIQQRYERLASYTADFEQTITHRESGSTERRQGRLLFKKPLLIHWQTNKPHEELLLVTSKEVWNYLPDEEIAWRYPLSVMQGSQGVIQVLTGQTALDRDFEVREEGREDGFRKLRLYPKEPSPQMVEALLWVDNNALIRRVSVLDFYGNGNDVRFTSFKADAPVRAADFTFQPPAGVDVENRDGTEGVQFFD